MSDDKRLLAIVAIVIVVVPVSYVMFYSGMNHQDVIIKQEETKDETEFIIETSGSVSADPNIVKIYLSVEKSSKNISEARRWVADNVSSVREVLEQKGGVSEENIQTVNFDIRKDKDNRIGPVARKDIKYPPVRYQAEHTLVVTTAKTNMAGKLVDMAVKQGATNINNIEFAVTTDKRKKLRREALEKAISNAKMKADVIESSTNKNIVGIKRVENQEIRINHRPIAVETAYSGGSATEISSGPLTVRSNVVVVFNTSG